MIFNKRTKKILFFLFFHKKNERFAHQLYDWILYSYVFRVIIEVEFYVEVLHMARLFLEHTKRNVQSLDGAWQFCVDREDRGEREEWFASLPASSTVGVPSVWNEESGLLDYEGAAWYEKEFFTRGGCLRLCFGAVMTEAKVWLDGSYLGSHYGGFSQFEFLVPEVAEGFHRLTVRVDNRFSDQSIPQKKVDWYHYGGIVRGVSLEVLEGICVLHHRLEYTLSEDLSAVEGHFVLECYNTKKRKSESRLTVTVGEETVFDGNIAVSGRKRQEIVLPAFRLEKIRLWDVGRPALYRICMTTETDDLIDRVGFRRVEVKQKQILLNGKPVEFRGVNRHEELPGFGFAFPVSRMKHDIDLILDLGCNSIRGSHYPNSQEFVDYLDETGILFWSEIPIWGCGFSQEALGDKTVVERGLEMHREMVKYYYNHPSIIFWGMHNEILSDTPEGLEMTKKYYAYLKENGGNRLVVYASNRHVKDISFGYTDVICLNMYFGWYSGNMPRWNSFMNEICDYLEEQGVSHLPIIFSEFGGGALYGFHDAECPKWSEEYQAKLLDFCLRLFHEHPAVHGSFVWQFCDIRTCAEMGFSRARGFNNKGIMNEQRRPKAAYYAVRKCYHDFAEEDYR